MKNNYENANFNIQNYVEVFQNLLKILDTDRKLWMMKCHKCNHHLLAI